MLPVKSIGRRGGCELPWSEFPSSGYLCYPGGGQNLNDIPPNSAIVQILAVSDYDLHLRIQEVDFWQR